MNYSCRDMKGCPPKLGIIILAVSAILCPSFLEVNGSQACSSQDWVHTWKTSTETYLTIDFSGIDKDGFLAVGGKTTHHASFNPYTSSAEQEASVVLLYDPDTLLPVNTFVFTHIGGQQDVKMLSFDVEKWGSKTIATTHEINSSQPDIYLAVFNFSGVSDYAQIAAAQDCEKTAKVYFQSATDLWIHYKHCTDTPNQNQLLQIVYDENQAAGSRFNMTAKYTRGILFNFSNFFAAKSTSTTTQMNIVSSITGGQEQCNGPGASTYTSSFNNAMLTTIDQGIVYQSCFGYRHSENYFANYVGLGYANTAPITWTIQKVVGTFNGNGNVRFVQVWKRRWGIAFQVVKPSIVNGDFTHSIDHQRFFELSESSFTVMALDQDAGRWIMILKTASVYLVQNISTSDPQQTIGTGSTQIKVTQIKSLYYQIDTTQFVKEDFFFNNMSQIYYRSQGQWVYGLNFGESSVQKYQADGVYDQTGHCLQWYLQDHTPDLDTAGHDFTTYDLDSHAIPWTYTSLGTILSSSVETQTNTEIQGFANYLNFDICTPNLSLDLQSVKLKAGLGPKTIPVVINSISPCFATPLDTQNDLVTTVSQIVEVSGGAVFLGSYTILGGHITLDPIPFTFSQLGQMEITFKICHISDSITVCSNKRHDQTVQFEVIQCLPKPPLIFPQTGQIELVDIDLMPVQQDKNVDASASQSCYFASKIFLDPYSATIAQIDGTIFSYTDRTFTPYASDTELITIDNQPFLSIFKTDYANEGQYDFILEISLFDTFPATPVGVTTQVPFSVKISANPCVPNLSGPALSQTYFSYMLTEAPLEIPLFATNGQCEFFYDLQLVGNGLDPLQTTLIQVFQPSFVADPSPPLPDPRYRLIDENGLITIHGDSQFFNYGRIYTFKLTTNSFRYTNEDSYLMEQFQVQIMACTELLQPSIHLLNFDYTLGVGLIDYTVNSLEAREDCYVLTTFEAYLIVDEKQENLPNFISFSQSPRTSTLAINTDLASDKGTYELCIIESSQFYNATSTTKLTLKVQEPLPEPVQEQIQSISTLEEEIQENLSTISTFSWQWSHKKARKSDSQKIVFPIEVKVFDFTRTGNLTITFSKPIIIPPIFVRPIDYQFGNKTDSNTTTDAGADQRIRLLQSTADPLSSRITPIYELHEVLKFDIQASTTINDNNEDLIPLKVSNYHLTRLEPQVMDIQLTFSDPQLLSQNLQWLDQLEIKFEAGNLFMDSVDFTQVDKNLTLTIDIVPQVTQKEQKQLEQIQETTEGVMTFFSLGQLIINSFLAMGLKYLWSLVNLLQFVVFIQTWVISLPNEAKAFLQALKALALFEFIPTDELLSMFGLVCDKNEIDPCACDKENSSANLVSNMGIMLIFGVLGVLILSIILILSLFGRKNQKIQAVIQKLKQKIFYNSFIRYVFQSTLKLQIAAASTIVLSFNFDHMRQQKLQKDICRQIQENSQEFVTTPSDITESLSFTSAILLIIFLSFLCPHLFGMVLHQNQDNLDTQTIRNKIGSLYLGLIPHRYLAKQYSTLFLLRRSIFVLISSVLFWQPGIQIQLVIFCTIQYIQFLHTSQIFEDRFQRNLETFNEIILIVICYHFVLLGNLVFDFNLRTKMGYSLIATTCLLLIVNVAVMINVSIRGFKEKVKLNKKRVDWENKMKIRSQLRLLKRQMKNAKKTRKTNQMVNQDQQLSSPKRNKSSDYESDSSSQEEEKIMNQNIDVNFQNSNLESVNEQKQKKDQGFTQIELPAILNFEDSVEQQYKLKENIENRPHIVKDTYDAFLSSKQSIMTEEEIHDFVEKSARSQRKNYIQDIGFEMINQEETKEQLPLKLKQKLRNVSPLNDKARIPIHPKQLNETVQTMYYQQSKNDRKDLFQALRPKETTIIDYRNFQRRYSQSKLEAQQTILPQKSRNLYQSVTSSGPSKYQTPQKVANLSQSSELLRDDLYSYLDKAKNSLAKMDQHFENSKQQLLVRGVDPYNQIRGMSSQILTNQERTSDPQIILMPYHTRTRRQTEESGTLNIRHQ